MSSPLIYMAPGTQKRFHLLMRVVKRVLLALVAIVSSGALAAGVSLANPFQWLTLPSGAQLRTTMADQKAPTAASGVPSTGVVAMPPSTAFFINGGALTKASSGFPDMRIGAASLTVNPGTSGEFRIACETAFMRFDDPLVYPGQPGKSHLHVFFGNTAVSSLVPPDTDLATFGNSTCAGGIANRSSYWVPAVIDTKTGFPVRPTGNNVYYKATSYQAIHNVPATVPVPGLRMIAGDPSNSNPSANTNHRYDCLHTNGSITNSPSFPGAECENGSEVVFLLGFPQCWDGVNLDSPNHQSHVAVSDDSRGCPSTHPVQLPQISYNIHYAVTAESRPENWRLSSDRYSMGIPGGLSAHGDWWNGWNQAVLAKVVNNCDNARVDCHNHLLGDGTTLY